MFARLHLKAGTGNPGLRIGNWETETENGNRESELILILTIKIDYFVTKVCSRIKKHQHEQ